MGFASKSVILSMLLILAIILGGCRNEEKLRLLVPEGSTQLSQLTLQNHEDYAVDVVIGADPLVAGFASQGYDVIFAPINLGAKLFHSNPTYQLGAVVVWGNLYLASRSTSLASWEDLDGSQITAFGQGQIPDIVLRYLLEELALSLQLIYVDSSATAASLLAIDPERIVLVAEPSLSSLAEGYPDIQILDLQDEYEALTDQSAFPQAGVFVHKDLDPASKARFLADLAASITAVTGDPDAAAMLAIECGMAYPQAVLAEAIPRSHLAYRTAASAKTDIEDFFRIILDFFPNLIGGSLPDDEFYL